MADARLEAKSSPPTGQKKHPAIIALEAFYQSGTIIDALQLFLKEDKQGELNYFTRIMHSSPKEKETLSKWIDQKYRYYIQTNTINSPQLSRRERSYLGVLYSEGYYGIIPKDPKKAEQLLKQAAQEGDGYAYYCLGDLILPTNKAEAINQWRKASEQGFVAAHERLGFYLESDHPGQAFEHFSLGAEAGFSYAMLNLGYRYSHDYGLRHIPNNVQLAYDNFMKAAAAGSIEALARLGRMFHHGTEATPQNNTIAEQVYETALQMEPNLRGTQRNFGLFLKDKNPGKAALHFRLALEYGQENTLANFWTLFQSKKSDPRVCFHAALAFHNRGTAAQQIATRDEFNNALTEHVGTFFDELNANAAEYSATFQALISDDNKIYECLRLLCSALDDTSPLPQATRLIVLAYVLPFDAVNKKLSEEELASKRWLRTQKTISEADMMTLFGSNGQSHLFIIQESEESKRSYTRAKRWILGR